jgi:two-component system sensor histidine kinase RegB
MVTSEATNIPTRNVRNWIRLRTLVLLRWWAIIGQVSALIVAQRVYGLELEIGLCYLAIGASAVSNVIAGFIFPETKRLSEREAFFIVLFDMLQLAALLYLTGGLHNPFSILIVGPVTVSASALSTRSTVVLGALAIASVTLLIFFHLPLQVAGGGVLLMPEVFLFGSWIAIVIAVVFLGVYSRWIVSEMTAMSEALQATQMALAREQKLTDLGGVVAAAAHELGTPLATIKLTSAELAEDLDDHPGLREDALLIREQADRCRDILRSMGRAGKDDLYTRSTPISALLEEAAEPHMARGKDIRFNHVAQTEGAGANQPNVKRQPEVIHGLRNLIQNAVDFARDTVWVESRWSEAAIVIRIMDNGPGYPPQMLGRIGEPLLRRRSGLPDAQRPGYEGMGLGLFIAKTLLERSGADLSFANGAESFDRTTELAQRRGAFVEVVWPRAALEAPETKEGRGLGENTRFTA